MKTVFISMIGLEERVLGIFNESTLFADKYILFVNQEYQDDERVIAYRKAIMPFLLGKDYAILPSSYVDPFVIIKEFNKLASHESSDFRHGDLKIVLDISTFNRQNLLVMLQLLRRILKIKEIEIVYTVPEQTNQEISKGAAGFGNVPLFGGAFSIEKKKLLLLLAGYEIDRPLLLWHELQPSKVILSEGVEPTDASFYGANRKAVQDLSKLTQAEVIQISANDPTKAKVQLASIFRRESKNYNIFVSPLNTKLQAVGLYLAWEENPAVQIVIAFPDRFSTWLTRGIKEIKRYVI